MEQLKQQQNMFYDEVHKMFEKKKPQTLISDLQKIDCTKPLSQRELKLLGGICYLVGMEFMQPIYTKEQKDRIAERLLTQNNINNEVWSQFNKTIKSIQTYDVLIDAKEAMKNLVSENVKYKSGKDEFVLNALIKTIIKSSDIPVTTALDINNLLTKAHFTWHDYLKFNSALFEQLIISGDSFISIQQLFNNPVYGEILSEASKLFDTQKFALLYFDGVCTYLEQAKQDRIDNLFSLNDSELSPMPTPEELEEQQNQEAELASQAENNINPEETDKFVLMCLKEALHSELNPESDNKTGNSPIESYEDLRIALEWVLNDEEYLQSFYGYIKRGTNQNRLAFEEVFDFDKDKFFADFNAHLIEIRDQYKVEVEKYHAEIPQEILNDILPLILACIVSLKIEDMNAKGYLLQQFAENQIHTYKQLHQIIDVIEKQNIVGNKLQDFVNLYEYTNSNETILKIFEESSNIDKTRLQLQFFSAMYDFYNFENLTEANAKDA